MTLKTEQMNDKVTVHFEAGKKAFHDAMAKAQSQIDVATAEVNKLRAHLKTQAAEAKAKTMARVDELTKSLDATRREQQDKIEARLKELHSDIESINAQLKHAAGEEKVALEAKAKAVGEEYSSARSAMTASLDAELVEWKARIGTALDAAVEKQAAAAKSAIQEKIADLHAKHDAAQKKVHALKQASAAAYGELQRGVRTAIGEMKTALQHVRSD
jgi:regulator of replication initiation timing